MKHLHQLSFFHFLLSMVMTTTSIPCRSNFLSSMIFIIQFSSSITSVHAEICSLCADGSYPAEPQSKFTYTKNGAPQAITCDMGYSLAPQGEFANCTALHAISSAICSCGKANVTKVCNLCYLGEKLPNPTQIIANKTCAGWEATANKDFASDCPAYQKTYGYACGCMTNSTMFNGYCSLCKKPLPDPNQYVRYTDGTSEFCTAVEKKLNVKMFPNCSGTQSKYYQACGCDKSPVAAGSKPSSSTHVMVSLGFICFSSLFVLHLLI